MLRPLLPQRNDIPTEVRPAEKLWRRGNPRSPMGGDRTRNMFESVTDLYVAIPKMP